MKIAVIDYNAGNIGNVRNALKFLKQEFEIVSEGDRLREFDKVIFPGVGSAGSAMEELKKRKIKSYIKYLKQPFLGICLGLQLLSDFSEEGNINCLSIIPGDINKFSSESLKVPQIGWNKVNILKEDPLFDGINDGEFFYFVNSYYLNTSDKYVLGSTSYGIDFASAVRKKNFWATQFHPEKSGDVGLKLLFNFCTKCW